MSTNTASDLSSRRRGDNNIDDPDRTLVEFSNGRQDNTDDDLRDAETAPSKRLTLSFKNVSVGVTAPDQALGETLWSRVDPRQITGFLNMGKPHFRVCSLYFRGCCMEERPS